MALFAKDTRGLDFGVKSMKLILGLGALSIVAACGTTTHKRLYDADQAVETMRILSADAMEGRRTGTEGNAAARAYLVSEFERLSLEPIGEGYEHNFLFSRKRSDGADFSLEGVNLVARLNGTQVTSGKNVPNLTMVISAHYDHEGVRGGEIFNGADDNASGVGALLAVAESFQKKAPKFDTVFVLFDAEELGLSGARHFVSKADKLPDTCMAFNLNLDMVSRSNKNELFVAGAFHTPALKGILNDIAAKAPVILKQGHDSPEDGTGDWTLLSDHGPFHKADIPFVYFGVEDHPDYHKPSDDFETVPLDFYKRAVDTIEMTSRRINNELDVYGRSCGS